MQSRETFSKIRTVCVVPVSTLSVGEDSEQSFQHQREGVGQQGPEDGGQGPARRSQGPLRGWDDCPHGFAEVAWAQDNGGGVQLELDAAAVDLWVPAAQRHQDRLCAKCFDVSAAVAWKRAGSSEMDRKVRKYTFLFLFFSERQRELGRSSKSYRHIFLQAHRQTAQPVWDSSPVCESLKCAFWPEDGEDQLSNIALTSLV